MTQDTSRTKTSIAAVAASALAGYLAQNGIEHHPWLVMAFTFCAFMCMSPQLIINIDARIEDPRQT